MALGRLAYEIAGAEVGVVLGVAAGIQIVFLFIAAIHVLSIIGAIRLWPARDPEDLRRRHDALQADHPHLNAHPTDAQAAISTPM